MDTMQIYRALQYVACWSVLALLVVCAPACAKTPAQGAAMVANRDMVWSAYDGLRREIFFSTQQTGGRWAEPVQLTNDNADNILPCIITTPDGKKYVVWTAMEQADLAVRYAVFDGTAWSEAKAVPGLPEMATMPFVAVDDTGILWLVFVGNDGSGHDDIYCIRLHNGSWEKAFRVNADNNVPDVNPFIEIDQDGAIQVTWEGFRNNGYVLLTSRWLGDRWAEEQPLAQEDQKKLQQNRKMLEEEQLPDFVEDRSMLFIRTNNE